MDLFIGTKTVKATLMTRAEYNEYRTWTLPANENGADEGYLVEYTDGGKPNDSRHEGYISWSPKEQFDNAYREINGMTFGAAIEALKMGKKVSRAGWNGKGMWLSLSNTDRVTKWIPAASFWSENNKAFADQQGGFAVVLPCITMKTATDEILMGWLASQTDVLAEDWGIVS